MRWSSVSFLGGAFALAGCRPAPVATPAPARPPITLTYLGVAGWQLDAGTPDHARVLVDPYFSRPNLDGPIVPDATAIAAGAPNTANLILVGHSHVDHVLDVPAVALRTGAEILGTPSTMRLARASGVPAEQLVQVGGGEDYAWDAVSVRVLRSLHSALDDKHAIPGEIAATPTLPMTFDEYGEGGTLAYLVRLGGHQVFVMSTANFIEREVEGLRPDVAIIAPGLREQVYDYTCRLLHALGDPPVVLPTHFDDWHAPLSTTPVPPDEELAAFVAEIVACAPGTRVIVPTPRTPIVID